MKKPIQDFFSAGRPTSQEELERALARLNPLLREQERKSMQDAHRSGFLSFKWLSIATAATAAALALLVLYPRDRASVVSPLPLAVAPAPGAATALSAPVAPKLEKKIAAHPSPNARAKPAVEPFQEVAVEFLKEMDLLLVLPVLRDLDVLRRWSGSENATYRLPNLRPFSLFNAAWADEIPLNDDFLDQLLKVFPNIPRKEQKTIISSLERLKPIWKKKKEVLLANFQTFRHFSPSEQQAYRERFETWQTLPEKSRSDILSKYDRWRKLTTPQKARIRERISAENSHG